mmetsp:Transcript_12386/g.27065  ORF Transcript_12386/g.27065 Transcript_12386/m.27065 type:complete len:135 (-) Transcript_12386:404-808(-)
MCHERHILDIRHFVYVYYYKGINCRLCISPVVDYFSSRTESRAALMATVKALWYLQIVSHSWTFATNLDFKSSLFLMLNSSNLFTSRCKKSTADWLMWTVGGIHTSNSFVPRCLSKQKSKLSSSLPVDEVHLHV